VSKVPDQGGDGKPDGGGGRRAANADIPPRPTSPPVDVEGIPAELRAKDRWVCWGYTLKDGKWDKPPLCGRAGTGPHNDWSAADKLAPFDVALATCGRKKLDGVGYVLADGEVGIDLDSCVGQNGVIAPEAHAMLSRLGTYAEFSPSGTGVKAILKARLSLENGKGKASFPAPWAQCNTIKNAKVEVFGPGAGYFTLTGRRVPGMPDAVNGRQAEAEGLLAELASLKKAAGEARASARQNGRTGRKAGGGPRIRATGDMTTPPGELTDEKLWARLFACKNGDAIRALYEGSITGYESASEATLALLNHLRWATRADPVRMDRMFRQSGLMRDKWDEPRGDSTWGAGQIKKALQGDTWEPRAEDDAAPAGLDAGGGATLHLGGLKETASGTIKAKVEVRKGGNAEDSLALSDTATGRDKFVKALAKVLTRLGADGSKAEALTTELILLAARRLKDKGTGAGATVHALVTARVPAELGLAFRCAKTVWSEYRRAEIGRGDLVTYTPDVLLLAAAACGDAPPGRDNLIRAVGCELGVLWADLMVALPDEAGAALGADSQRARAFWRAVVQQWKHALVFEVERGKDNPGMEHAARSTLAQRARRIMDRGSDGQGLPPGEWVPVMTAFDAFICVPVGGGLPLLGMRATLGGQVKHPLPGILDGDDELLRKLGVRYGAVQGEPAVPAQLENGQRFAVLTPALAAEIMALPLTQAAGSDEGRGEPCR